MLEYGFYTKKNTNKNILMMILQKNSYDTVVKSYGSIYGNKTINEHLAKALLLLAMVVIASIKY